MSLARDLLYRLQPRFGKTRYDKIVLLRHGQNAWNEENRFTGWTDVELSRRWETPRLSQHAQEALDHVVRTPGKVP